MEMPMTFRTTLINLSVLAALCLPASASEGLDTITLIPAPALEWASTPEGVAFAALDGDRFAGPYQAMVRLPSGISSPLHVKSANMFGVMIQGEMIHFAKGEDRQKALRVGAGSFYKIPKGLAHVSACVSKVPCIAYLFQDGKFDFVPVAQ
jgi:hypothetical protein